MSVAVACAKPWVQSPASRELSVEAYTFSPSTQQRQERQFKVILVCIIVSLSAIVS